MRRVTVDELMSWKPCKDYPRELVEELWDGREALTHREIAELDIPRSDVVWTLIRMLSREQVGSFARWCALRVANLWRAPDVVVRYLETGYSFLLDEVYINTADADAYTVNTAADSAYTAAYVAYAANAYIDANAVYVYTANVVCAYTAAYAYAAATAAAEASANYDAERREQIDYLIGILGGDKWNKR